MPYGAKSRAQYYAIKNALSGPEKSLINFYELQWALRSHVPTVDECAQHLNLKHVEINYMLTRREVVKALEKRGIPWRQHSQVDLTPTQVAVAITMMNFSDTRSNSDKLDQMGVNATQYQAWLKDPTFKNLIDNLADQNLNNIRPTAIGELTKKINEGDWNAIKYYLDATGEFAGDAAPQSEQLIRMIIEIIQRHVKDPVTIMAIATDIKAASQNRTLEVVDPHSNVNPQHREITGELVEAARIAETDPQFTGVDPELEKAKKMLGVY